MKTYVEVMVSADGEKASNIVQKLQELGLESSIGEHDFVYNWKEKASMQDVLAFADKVQSKLKGSGAILSFTTLR